MGTTANFVKLRSSNAPKPGEWNINYDAALAKAKKEGKFIVTCWSNGDICGFCVAIEKCMMTATFKDWLKKQDAYFVFQHSKDKDGGKVLHDLIFKSGGVKQYPGFRITYYDEKGKVRVNYACSGNDLRESKAGAGGAKNMIANIENIFEKKPGAWMKPVTEPNSGKTESYKVRFNEKLTVKKVNAILDAIDKNGGYCPCQPGKTDDTKCHCKDFKENKKIGEPCICNLFVKQPSANVSRACDLARECITKAKKTYIGESVGIRATKKKPVRVLKLSMTVKK